MSDVAVRAEHRACWEALGRYLPRLCRWPVLASGLVAAWALTWWRVGEVATELQGVWLVRTVAAAACVVAVFALDDPSRDVTEPAVGTRRLLMPGRLLVAICVTVVALLPAMITVAAELTAVTLWGLVLEAATVLALLTAASLALQRRWGLPEPAQYLVLGVVLLAVYDQLTAGRWPLLAGPGLQWADAHLRWAALAAIAVVVLVRQLRDPAAR